jgi:serine/threonine protein phosphatase PrpC
MTSRIPPTGEVTVTVFGRTDVGRTREHNEDAFVVADLSTNNATLRPEVRTHTAGDRGSLFMVADGMGGAAAGEIASDMAVKIVLDELQTNWLVEPSVTDEAFVRAIKNATKSANEQINNYATSHPEFRGMGTTATVAGLFGDTLYLAQVGDSRGYLVREGVVRQITKDQSQMQKLIEAGELTEEEAEQSERRNIILQALGPEPTIKVDLTHQQLRRGDTLVLCSDGLSGQVSKDEIGRIVADEPDLTNACKQLIDRANENGGPDNITVILARFDGEGLRPPGEADEVGHRVYPLNDTGHTPAIPIDRVTDQNAITQPVDVPPRRRTTPKMTDAAALRASGAARSNGADPAADVSPHRRSAGRLIAVALLALLVLGATYFAVKLSRGASDTTSTGAPPGSPRH